MCDQSIMKRKTLMLLTGLVVSAILAGCGKSVGNGKTDGGLGLGSTGAEDRSVHVGDFGATPNDGEDDSEAIRRAIEYAKERGMNVVVLDAGVYDLKDGHSVLIHGIDAYIHLHQTTGLSLRGAVDAQGYPQEDGFQYLGLIDVATGRCTQIGRFRHHAPGRNEELRCDLHPRWSRDGRFLTVDSIHEGERRIFMLEMAPVIEKIEGAQ